MMTLLNLRVLGSPIHAFDFQMHDRMCPSELEGTVSQTSQYKDSKIKHLCTYYRYHHTNLKKSGDRAFCAYAPRLWNELPDNIKAADSVQNFQKQLKTLLFRKGFIWTIHLSTDYF